MRKIRFLIVFMMLMFVFTTISYGDLEDIERINGSDIKNEVSIETSKTVENEPNINSRIGLIYDRNSGQVLFEKNGYKQTLMASTTKIMTAIVVVENSNLSKIVEVDNKSAQTGGSRLGLKKNDKITINDLLYGLMMKSGNDAAVQLAISVGKSVPEFAKIMNDKATELGLKNTHFVVPHGLDIDGHYTTAYELAKIADYALKIPKIREIVSTKTHTVYINNRPMTINNTNELLGSLNGVYGVKTGFTNGAGRCLVTSCKRDDIDIITVILGADTKKMRTADSIKLIEYANKNFKMVNIKKKVIKEFSKWKGLNENRIIVNKGKTNMKLELEDLEFEMMAVKNTQVDNIKIEANSVYYFDAPVEEKCVIGNLKIMIGDETVKVVNIYNKHEIEKKNVKDYIFEFLRVLNET